MIASFACRHTHALWLGQKPTALPSTIHQTSLRKLTQIQAATSLVDLRIPQPLELYRMAWRGGKCHRDVAGHILSKAF